MTRVIRERVLGTGAPGTGFDMAGAAEVRANLARLDMQRFDVTAYGAVPDGTTPCDAAFAAARADAEAVGGGIIFIPPVQGDPQSGLGFRLTQPLDLTGAMRIHYEGVGWASVIIVHQPFIESSGTGTDDISIRSVQVRNRQITNTFNGIEVNYPRRWDVAKCFFNGFGGRTVWYKGGLDSRITDNYVYGMDPKGENGHSSISTTASDTNVYATTMTVSGNYVAHGQGYGIHGDWTHDSIWDRNIVEHTDVGMRFANCDGELRVPYTEAIRGNPIELHDAHRLLVTGYRIDEPIFEPVVTWSAGIPNNNRYITKFSQRGDHTLGRDITVGRGIYVLNAWVEPPTPTAGGVLYVQGGNLRYKSSRGNVTTIAEIGPLP